MKYHPNDNFMSRAIEIARTAIITNNYPIGAVIVRGRNEILSVRHTELHSKPDPTGHAEILALREAAYKLNSKYLIDCFLYTTLEPCPMCTAAAIWAKLSGIVFGATREDAKKIYLQRVGDLHDWRQIDVTAEYLISRGRPKLELYSGVLREECIQLLKLI